MNRRVAKILWALLHAMWWCVRIVGLILLYTLPVVIGFIGTFFAFFTIDSLFCLIPTTGFLVLPFVVIPRIHRWRMERKRQRQVVSYAPIRSNEKPVMSERQQRDILASVVEELRR